MSTLEKVQSIIADHNDVWSKMKKIKAKLGDFDTELEQYNFGPRCAKCGVRLKAEWKEIEGEI